MMLSQFVALSVSLIRQVSPLQEGGEHGFGGAKDPAQIDAAYDRARSFMAQHWGVSAPRL